MALGDGGEADVSTPRGGIRWCEQCGKPSIARVCSRECLDAQRSGVPARRQPLPEPPVYQPKPEASPGPPVYGEVLGDFEWCACGCGYARGELRLRGEQHNKEK